MSINYKKTIEIKTSFKVNRVFLEIRDNGIGISEEDMDKIFDPFFTTKSVEDGTGLGLSIVYSLVKEMKGDISISSKFQESTEVIVSFPIKKRSRKES